MRLLVVAVGVAVTAGCGGDEGVTRAEWARAAIDLVERERAELAGLEAPGDDEREIRTMLGHLDDAAAAGRRAQAAARRGDLQAATVAVGESDSAAAQARHVARDLEAATCAEP